MTVPQYHLPSTDFSRRIRTALPLRPQFQHNVSAPCGTAIAVPYRSSFKRSLENTQMRTHPATQYAIMAHDNIPGGNQWTASHVPCASTFAVTISRTATANSSPWNMVTAFMDGQKCAAPPEKPVTILFREPNLHNEKPSRNHASGWVFITFSAILPPKCRFRWRGSSGDPPGGGRPGPWPGRAWFSAPAPSAGPAPHSSRIPDSS